MEYLAWFIFLFITMQFLISLLNLLFSEKMKTGLSHPGQLVSILVPARNESKNIEDCIQHILDQPYKNFELIVCDDQSDDETAEIVSKYVAIDERIKLIHTHELPPGWLGKNFACFTLSQHAMGEYYLFLDADVRIGGNLISQAISHLNKYNLSLISIFPKQLMKSFGEKISVPVMNYILLTLLPLILVRASKFTSLSAANGQFMFFKAAAYKETDPHFALKSNKVEDIAISRLFKSNRMRVSCQVGDNRVTCRMYENYKDSVNGFSRNIKAYFGNSCLLAFIFWLVTTLGAVVVFWKLSFLLSCTFILIYILTRILVSITSSQNIWDNILLILHQQISLLIFIINSVMRSIKKDYQWKGRNII